MDTATGNDVWAWTGDGRADLAVHSAKDVPTTPTAGLVIGAFTQRRSPADALVGRSLIELPDLSLMDVKLQIHQADISKLKKGQGAWITEGGSTVRGMVINRFSTGIALGITNESNLIEGNFIGTDVTGTASLGRSGSRARRSRSRR